MRNDTTNDNQRNARGDELKPVVSELNPLTDGTPDDLATILKAVQARDRAAFGELYDMTVQRVYGLALSITRRPELAEEVVSDVYFQAWQHADSYSSARGKVIAWLCVLCRSRALDALRRNKKMARKAEVNIDVMPEVEDPLDAPDILLTVERGSAIQSALAKLSDEQRQLVALAYFKGYTHSELAGFLAIPIGTVKTNLRRAMIKLKETISNGESHE